MVMAPETALPPVGYGIGEVERILQIPKRRGYALIKEGRLQAFLSIDNKLKVSPLEVYRVMCEVEQE